MTTPDMTIIIIGITIIILLVLSFLFYTILFNKRYKEIERLNKLNEDHKSDDPEKYLRYF